MAIIMRCSRIRYSVRQPLTLGETLISTAEPPRFLSQQSNKSDNGYCRPYVVHLVPYYSINPCHVC